MNPPGGRDAAGAVAVRRHLWECGAGPRHPRSERPVIESVIEWNRWEARCKMCTVPRSRPGVPRAWRILYVYDTDDR